jgi:hypothetical protein
MSPGDLVRVIFDKPTEPLSSWYQQLYRNQDIAVVLQVENLPHSQKIVHILYDGKPRIVMHEHLRKANNESW